MRILLAGASGAIGKRLIPLLLRDDHHVIATTRTPHKLDGLRAAGADPIVMDALDRDAVMKTVVRAHPDVIVHQMTALTGTVNMKKFDEEFAITNRLRTEGTAHLLGAAAAAGAHRFVAQSYTGWPNAHDGSLVKSEDDSLDPNPPGAMSRTLDAIRRLEAMVTGASGLAGLVLRYGTLYGPGTSIAPAGGIVALVRKRRLPIVGSGAGVWSFTHIDDAANATRLATEGGAPGLYNIVDDEPAAVSVWLPELAKALGARPPFHLPRWLGRLAIGEAGLSVMEKARGSSNAKAKRTLNWQPIYATWRDGFRQGLGPEASTPTA